MNALFAVLGFLLLTFLLFNSGRNSVRMRRREQPLMRHSGRTVTFTANMLAKYIRDSVTLHQAN